MTTVLRAGSATHVGMVRSNNQDRPLVVAEHALYGVADGMGGHQGGEVASELAVALTAEHATEPSLASLKEAVRLANRAIFEKAGSDRDLHGMGTTLVAIQVVDGPDGDEIAWVNVGDSRVYLYRDDRLIQLSFDHSLVEDLVRDGQLTEDEAAVHPQRNIITRALGIDLDVDVDGSTVLPYTGDRFLLSSDGLFNEVSSDQMSSVLRRLEDPDEAAAELVRLANEGGGRDNITVVVVDVVDDGGRAEAAAAILAAQDGTVESTAPTTAEVVPGPDPDPQPVKEEPRAAAPPVFAGQRSSLPEADDDYAAENDDLFGDIGHARTRRITGRVVLFLLLLLVVGAVVVGAIAWSANKTYFVAFAGDDVVVYQGKPGGVLVFDPKVVDPDTGITRAELTEAEQSTVEAQREFSDRAAASAFLLGLQQDIEDRATTTTAPTTTTTTQPAVTTIAPPTTAAAPTTAGGSSVPPATTTP